MSQLLSCNICHSSFSSRDALRNHQNYVNCHDSISVAKQTCLSIGERDDNKGTISRKVKSFARKEDKDSSTNSHPAKSPTYNDDVKLRNHGDTKIKSIYHHTKNNEVSVNDDVDNEADRIDNLFSSNIQIDFTSAIAEASAVDGNNNNESGEEGVTSTISATEGHLLYLMTKYNVPAAAYPKFMEWAAMGCEAGFNFSVKSSFKTVVNKLLSSKPQMHAKIYSVRVHVGAIPSVSVYFFSFIDNIQKLINDQELMSGAVWKYNNDNNGIISEMNTGSWWQNAENKMINSISEDSSIPHDHHFLVPILLFSDATHCDRNGCLQAEPVLLSIGNIRVETRKLAKSWCFLGLIPGANLTKKEKENKRVDYLNFYHTCIKVILQELIDYQNNDKGKGYVTHIDGIGQAALHFEVALVIGNTAGHDAACGRFKAYSKKISRPVRCCNCPHEELSNPRFKCQPNNQNVIEQKIKTYLHKINSNKRVGKYREKMRKLSQCNIVPSMFELSYGCDPEGLYGATTFETLHTLLKGMSEYALRHLYDYHKIMTKSNGQSYKKNYSSQKNLREEFGCCLIQTNVKVIDNVPEQYLM